MEKILIIDDEQFIRDNVNRVLSEDGYETIQAADGKSALEAVSSEEIDLALLDLNLGSENGIDILRSMKKIDPELLIIVITGYGSVETAVESLKLGAFHYMKKPFKADALRLIVKLALQTSNLKREVRAIRKNELLFFEKVQMVGVSSSLKEIMHQAREVARHSDATVLITGESGTGKELISKSIHHLSGRREAPFIEINCASIPVNLLESELFGHEKGAFTDAKERKQGLFEAANRGTIFLDEVGEMDPAVQAKLLRVLESRTIRRIGGIKNIEVDVRVIAATNRNLKEAMQNGSFREDLFYRLNVFPIHIPPLRERLEDIPSLVTFFLETYSRQFSRSFTAISPEAMKRLCAYSWPGNIRELKNSIERICIMNDSESLETGMLPPEIRGKKSGEGEVCDTPQTGLEEAVEALERRMIRCALASSGNNVLQAAQLLKIPRGTLRYKIEKLGIAA
ncbi:MAG: sigma-54-dependent Fis family transcriptional regulator [Geobacteraceae bacterium]|nr:sigma-54-dependent Fis family transcriptional regulator [Geobacteraceae bacterium]